MRTHFKILLTFLLIGCQTIGLVNEDPRAPYELQTGYEKFASVAWSKEVSKPIINFEFFGDKVKPNKFFDIAGNEIFIIDENTLRKIDINTGESSSSIPLRTDKIMSGISVAYNTFFYTDIDGKIYSHDLSSGDVRWSKNLKDLVISKALVTPLHIYVQTSSDVLYAFDFQTGEVSWSKKAQAPLLSIRGTSYPIFYEGLIFTSFSNGRLAAIRAEDGIQLWEKPISRIKGSTELEKLMDADSPAIAFDEFVYAANFNGSLTRFNIRGGEKIFSIDLSTTKPILQFRDYILAINIDDEIIAFDALNGTEKWRNSSFKYRKITQLVLIGNNIYFGDLDGYIHAVNAQTGETVGQQPTELEGIIQIEARSEKLVVQDINGSLSVFNLD